MNKVLIFFSISFLFNNLLSADEIKTKDLGNSTINSSNISDGSTNASISPEQAQEIQKQVKAIKESQKKAAEQLDEMEKDL
jgi:hypothetical protein